MSLTPKGKQEGRRRIIPVAALLLCAALAAMLGGWQVQRLAWKEALIAHVAAVSGSAPKEAAALPFTPTEAALADLEYRHVRTKGQFAPQGTTLVSALTEEGAGFWVMTPLRLADGRMVWINRGFMPLGTKRAAMVAQTPAGDITITGLLRKPEPKGRFLQPNQPEHDRWYSRDIAAMATARGIPAGAAWFIDAEASGTPAKGQPIAGLTVVNFANNHLQYALTWFALAGMCLFAVVLVMRRRG